MSQLVIKFEVEDEVSVGDVQRAIDFDGLTGLLVEFENPVVTLNDEVVYS